MEFIRDYRHFIEVGCPSCGRKHTVQKGRYNLSPQGYEFHAALNCPCGQSASAAGKGKRTWAFKSENNELMKRNKATSIKIMLVIGFTILFIASEMFYMFHTQEEEQKSAEHEVKTEASSHLSVPNLYKL
ncbi:hypothetical protein [Paenibacillus paridis]|uniref:hypothetical protein n=1 Tax=Paenibacillus paridis TaxID=2583376 RepID=UPI001121931C|nr:hypothetical protein [Paenibacillus paridis]